MYRADLIRALEEVTSDVQSTASLAKTSLLRGMYLRQSDNEYVLAMDVPGLHTNELVVTADRGTLRIKGEHKCPKLAGTDIVDPLCVDRYYDATFTFPSDADEDHVKAHLDAGVAYVKVPKITGERRGLGRIIELTEEAAGRVYEGSGAKWMVDTAAEGANVVKDKIVGGAKVATDTAAQATESIKSAAGQATDSIKSAAGQAADTAKRGAHAATETVKSAAGQATDTAKRGAHSVTETVKGTAAGATEVPTDGKGFVERMTEQIVKPIQDRIQGVKQGSSEGNVPVEKKDEL